MLSREQARSLIEKVIRMADADQVEVLIFAGDMNSTRFSGNAITQNVGLTDHTLRLRVINGKRQGIAVANQFDDDSIRRCVGNALAVARVAAEDNNLPPLIDKQPTYKDVDPWRASTAEFTPDGRAKAVRAVLDAFDERGLEGAGVFDTGQSCAAYGNHHGVFAYGRNTKADFNVSAFADGGSVEGWAESMDLDVDRVKPVHAGAIAAGKAEGARNPVEIAPGEYTVVLEPAAVAELMLFLGRMTANGLAFAERRSFHKGELGQKLLDDKLTIVEDPFHPELGGLAFDMEGMPQRRVTLIENGVFKAVCHDRRSAALCGAESTGHANPQPDARGPTPGSLVMTPGDASIEEMIGGTARGLLITKFHYTNVVNQQDVSITGMTRAGTYLIEDGKLKHAVKNMRFTQSLLTAFADVEAVGKEAHASGGALFGGNVVAPAVKLKHWRFSSPTGF